MTTIGQTAWFAPLESATAEFISAYIAAPDDRKIVGADMFTIALDSVAVPKEHIREGFLPHLVHLAQGAVSDILVLSTTVIGAQPQVQRVHYYGPADQFEHAFTEFISDVMYITSDFHPLVGIDLTLHVVAWHPGKTERDTLLTAFKGLAGSAGAVFPVLLPYSSLLGSVGDAANKLLDAIVPSDETRISQTIKLKPAGDAAQIDLQVGRYVLLDREADLSTFSVAPDGRLLRANQDVVDMSYAVFRVERRNVPAPDYVVSQQVATLLTQLTQSQSDPFKSPLEFVGETMLAYKKFQDLQRLADLAKKKAVDPNSLCDPEKAVMKHIEDDPALKAFLPARSG